MSKRDLKFDLHDFPMEEYVLRYDRARSLMEREGLDALLISDDGNYRYFTGHPLTTRNRPSFAVLPSRGEITLITEHFVGRTLDQVSWVREKRFYPTPFNSAILIQVFREMDLAEKTIGVDWDDRFFGAFRTGLQRGDQDALHAQMPKARFVDASRLIWELRMLKTRAEVQALRQACVITAQAYEELWSVARVGITERDAAQILIGAMMRHGADYPFRGKPGPCALMIMNSSGHPDSVPAEPLNQPIGSGDLLRVDMGAVYRGYVSDFSRSAIFGIPSIEQLEAWQRARELVRQGIEALRPGYRLGNIPTHWHGIGQWYVEPPFGGVGIKAVHGDMIARPGMVLCIETGVEGPRGETFSFEDIAAVTEDGYELLSETDDTLRRIG